MKAIMRAYWLVLLLAGISLSGCGVEWFPDAKQPEAFSFESQNNVAVNTVVTSNKVTLVNNTEEGVITVVNGEYSVDGGEFTRAPGKLKAGGGTLQVRHTSASTPGTATVTTVDVSGRSATFTSTTTTATVVVPTDSTPPSVSSVSPADKSTGIAATSPIVMNFSEAMDSSTINTTNIRLLAADSTQVNGTVSYAGLIATFTPSSALADNTSYTLTISGVKDPSGNALAAQFSVSFTTGVAGSTEFVTLGSTPADVERIQGTPTTKEDFTSFYRWRYDNKGSYTFSSSTDTVISWGSINGGLKVKIIPGSNTTDATTVTVGSHADDVARLLGTPDAIDVVQAKDLYIWYYTGLGNYIMSYSTQRVTSIELSK